MICGDARLFANGLGRDIRLVLGIGLPLGARPPHLYAVNMAMHQYPHSSSLMENSDASDADWATLRGRCVLVVEDGWQVADALKLSLEKLGMVVAGPVATTAEAQSVARERCPDVAIVDVNLSGEMAYGLMDWLHSRGMPVIVISGYEDLPGSLQKFSAILHKPFTATALLMALKFAVAPAP